MAALRVALHDAVDAFFDSYERATTEDRVRRLPTHPVAQPQYPPSELDRESARAELRRMGAEVKKR